MTGGIAMRPRHQNFKLGDVESYGKKGKNRAGIRGNIYQKATSHMVYHGRSHRHW